MRRGLNLQFRLVNGLSINTLDEETIEALAEAGLIWAPIAIESGSDFIRNKVVRKNLSRRKIFNTVKWFRRYPHILLSAFFIVGFPEETTQTLQDTYEMIRQLDIDFYNVSLATPFPGTSLFKQCLKDGLLINYNGGWDQWNLFTANLLSTQDNDVNFINPYNLSISELNAFQRDVNDLCQKRMTEINKQLFNISTGQKIKGDGPTQ